MKEFTFHPHIWNAVIELYNFYYPREETIKEVLRSLGLDVKRYVESTSLKEYLCSLEFSDGLIIIRDILQTHKEYHPQQASDSLGLFGSLSFFSVQNIIKTQKEKIDEEFRENSAKRIVTLLAQMGISFDWATHKFSSSDKEIEDVFPKRREVPLLIDQEFEDFFYSHLKDEINKAYRLGLFTSVMLLSRKIIENLVIDILRLKFPPSIPNNLLIYYNEKEMRFHDFTLLIKNLEDRKNEFHLDKETLADFISLVKPFRPSANSNAHSIVKISDEKEILNFQIPRMIALLKRL